MAEKMPPKPAAKSAPAKPAAKSAPAKPAAKAPTKEAVARTKAAVKEPGNFAKHTRRAKIAGDASKMEQRATARFDRLFEAKTRLDKNIEALERRPVDMWTRSNDPTAQEIDPAEQAWRREKSKFMRQSGIRQTFDRVNDLYKRRMDDAKVKMKESDAKLTKAAKKVYRPSGGGGAGGMGPGRGVVKQPRP